MHLVLIPTFRKDNFLIHINYLNKETTYHLKEALYNLIPEDSSLNSRCFLSV